MFSSFLRNFFSTKDHNERQHISVFKVTLAMLLLLGVVLAIASVRGDMTAQYHIEGQYKWLWVYVLMGGSSLAALYISEKGKADRFWEKLSDIAVALRPMRFCLLSLLLMTFVLMFTSQGQDALVAYSESSEIEWLPPFSFLFLFSWLLWTTCRTSVLFSFGTASNDESERDVLTNFRSTIEERDQGHLVRTGVAHAQARVASIFRIRRVLPHYIAIAPLFIFGLSLLVNTYIFDVPVENLLSLELIAVFVGAAVWVTTAIHAKVPPLNIYKGLNTSDLSTKYSWDQLERPTQIVAVSIAAVVFAFFLLCFLFPVSTGQCLGVVGVFIGILSLIAVGGTGLAMVSRQSSLPIFSIFAVIFVVVHSVGGESYFRVQESASEMPTKIAERLDPTSALAKATDIFPEKEPIVFVATAGGGSRAAYWTATLLEHLDFCTKELRADGRSLGDRTFAISAVSGGSLGAAVYRLGRARGTDPVSVNGDCLLGASVRDTAKKDDSLMAQIRNMFIEGDGTYDDLTQFQTAASGDFLSPALAAMFTRDLFAWRFDRNVALEQAWERSWNKGFCGTAAAQDEDCAQATKGTFLDLFRKDSFPALLLNSTSVETGSRVIVSNLKLSCPSTHESCGNGFVDSSDLLAVTKRDLPLSSATGLSARFPGVGAAALSRIRDNDCDPRNFYNLMFSNNLCPEGQKQTIYSRLVDGGYYENNGAHSISDLLTQLAPHLEKRQLVVIQITSDSSVPADGTFTPGEPFVKKAFPSRLLSQARAPANALLSARSAHGRRAQELLRLKTKELNGTYVHFRLCNPPNGDCEQEDDYDAPLAWYLSDAAQAKIEGALQCEENQAEYQRLVGALK